MKLHLAPPEVGAVSAAKELMSRAISSCLSAESVIQVAAMSVAKELVCRVISHFLSDDEAQSAQVAADAECEQMQQDASAYFSDPAPDDPAPTPAPDADPDDDPSPEGSAPGL